MAITTNLPTDSRLIAGFNPYYLNFSSNAASYDKATVQVRTSGGVTLATIELTANVGGLFSYNLSGIIKATVREYSNFLEPQYVYPDISTPLNALFDDSTISRGYLFRIDISNGGVVVDTLVTTIPVYFLKASRQILGTADMIEYSYNVSPPALPLPLTVNDSKVICWSGYPLDVQFDAFNSIDQIIKSDTSTVLTSSIAASGEDRMLRLVLIDILGNELTDLSTTTSYTIENRFGDGPTDFINTVINVDYRVPTCEGKYFRFTNSNGGQSFWLFTDVYTIEKQRKNGSRVQRNFNILSGARSRDVSLGNEVTDYLVVNETTASVEENNIMNELINSPIIELWEGLNRWRRVEMTNNSGGFNNKTISKQFNFTFDLGTIYNQSY